MKRFLLILCAFTLLTVTPSEAQTAQPSAGPVPKTTTIQYTAVPELVEVVGNGTTVVGWAKKADVFKSKFTTTGPSTLDVWDRNGTTLRGRLHPNGAGYVPLGGTVPPATNTPQVFHSAPNGTSSFYAGTETAFTGHLADYDNTPQKHYCGVGHAQIGAPGADQYWGVSVTRPALFYGACALNTATEGLINWLGVRVTMMKNNRICGISTPHFNHYTTAIFWMKAGPCQPGYAEWRTISNHQIWSPQARDWLTGYNASPWMVY